MRQGHRQLTRRVGVCLLCLLLMAALGCMATPVSGQSSPSPVLTTPLPDQSPLLTDGGDAPVITATPSQSDTPTISPTAPPVRTQNASPRPSIAATPPPSPAQRSALENALVWANKKPEAVSFRQLIVVAAKGSSCTVMLYQREGSDWALMNTYSGHLGANGLSSSKKEGDKKTPSGLFSLGTAFGNGTNPGTKMPYRAVTEQSYWVDDPASAFYNTWVEGTEHKDWASAEKLWTYQSAYAHAVVVNYNTPPVAGKGSAIFLHCGSKTTAGCISLPAADLVNTLKWLSPDQSPHILILPQSALD